MRNVLFGLSASVLVAVPAARADVTIVSEHSGSGETRTATIQAKKDLFRADGGGGRGPGYVIGDAAARKLTVVSVDRRSYFEISPDDLGRAAAVAQNPAVQAMMQEQMKNLPPEQRARIEAMMAQQGGAPGAAGAAAAPPRERNLRFEKTGEKKTVNGFACETYRVSEDGKPIEQDCIAPFGASTLTKEDGENFKRIADMFKSLRGPAAQAGSQIEGWHQYPGFPIVQSKLGPDGKVSRTTTVKSIKHDALGAEVFQVPAGFSKSAGPGMMMGGAGRAE